MNQARKTKLLRQVISNPFTKFAQISISVSLCLAAPAMALDAALFEQVMREYRQDPVAFSQKRPARFDSQGRPYDRLPPHIPSDRDRLWQLRDDFRRQLLESQETTEQSTANHLIAPILAIDQPQNLVDEGHLISNLNEMQKRGLLSAVLEDQPWSADYWPIANGGLGKRFADPNFPQNFDWQENRDYIEQNPAQSVLSSGDAAAINMLSPSEKYELIIGDNFGFLTSSMWTEGERYFKASGEVESWFGYCHGWAAASFMLPRAETAIEVPAKNHDFKVTLYPSEIHALALLLWSNVRPETKLIGGRCYDKQPRRDEQTGRILDPECFDTNPGAWHQSVVSQIGSAKRSMIMDTSFDYEVWNQPIISYSYRYFNLLDLSDHDSYQNAQVALEDLTEDRFIDFRSPETKYVVGVAMEVTYIAEIPATHKIESQPKDDRLVKVFYLYDLELGQDGEIIGGEWHQQAHPDFLWTPAKGVKARTAMEYGFSDPWLQGEKIPDSWMMTAHWNASVARPLGVIVEGLIERARLPVMNNSKPVEPLQPEEGAEVPVSSGLEIGEFHLSHEGGL